MKKALTFGLYVCLFLFTSVSLWSVHSAEKGHIDCSCWDITLQTLQIGKEQLHNPTPYLGGLIDDTNPNFREHKLVEQFSNGGASYTAIWDGNADGSTETIEYYKDRNGRCLADCGLSLHIPIADHYCSHWYTISEDGLVVINTYYLLSYLSLAFIASVLPSIVWLYSLYKIIFYLVQFWHTHGHHSH